MRRSWVRIPSRPPKFKGPQETEIRSTKNEKTTECLVGIRQVGGTKPLAPTTLSNVIDFKGGPELWRATGPRSSMTSRSSLLLSTCSRALPSPEQRWLNSNFQRGNSHIRMRCWNSIQRNSTFATGVPSSVFFSFFTGKRNAKRVLLVDDNQTVRKAARRVFVSSGFVCHEADSGAKAIEQVPIFQPDYSRPRNSDKIVSVRSLTPVGN